MFEVLAGAAGAPTRHLRGGHRAIAVLGIVMSLHSDCASDSKDMSSEFTMILPFELPALPVEDLGPLLSLECRPKGTRWVMGERLLLPCEPTYEPCDLIDNDGDGITDPHCPSVPCSSDAECTYGGLIPDADCDMHARGGPGWNQIDGVEAAAELCQGMLCPPGLKCDAGECVVPGKNPPCAPCTKGADCPINSGCIPVDEWQGFDNAVCVTFCHEFPCPEGTVCIPEATIGPAGKVTHTLSCRASWGCREARYGCEKLIAQCNSVLQCELGQCVLERCSDAQDTACVLECAQTHYESPFSSALAQCVIDHCGA